MRPVGRRIPLIAAEQPIGVLLFMAAEKNAFTREFVELLQRLADNVSFALENFDRADEESDGRASASNTSPPMTA